MRMRVIGVVQARYSSQRLPGKILKRLLDRPALGHLLEGLTHSTRMDGLIIATSSDPTDDATAEFVCRSRIALYRGPLEDVARRIFDAGKEQGADAVVRINGDSPLLDPALIDQGIDLFRSQAVDIVTNVLPRTFPKGQSVEVIRLEALGNAVGRMCTPAEREHVTPYIYANPQEFSKAAFSTDPSWADVQLSIDDANDFERCASILRRLDRPPWQAGWRACVDAYQQCLDATAAVGH